MAFDYDVAIIGAGASGSYAATVFAKCSNKTVVLIDSNDRIGKKLSLTGNGQGNVSNEKVSASSYFSLDSKEDLDRVASLVKEFSPSLLSTVCLADERGRIYPGSKQASSITDIFRKTIEGKVTLKLGSKVVRLSPGYNLQLDSGEKISAEFVILACGGAAQPRLGSDGSGHDLAKALGHSVTKLYPSLVQLTTETDKIRGLKGKRLEAELSLIDDNDSNAPLARSSGEIIFQDYGITGDAVFDLSPHFAGKKSATISINFLYPFRFDYGAVKKVLEERDLSIEDKREIFTGILPNQVGRKVVEECLNDYSVDRVIQKARSFDLKVTGSLGFDRAQVTRGGIRLNEVSDNLESRLSKKLFITGEMLDIDGPCGGYNLHWAFSSVLRAAKAIINYGKNR